MRIHWLTPTIAAISLGCGIDQQSNVDPVGGAGGVSGAVGNGGFPTGGSAGDAGAVAAGGTSGAGGVTSGGGTAGAAGSSTGGSGGAMCPPAATPAPCPAVLPAGCSTCAEGECLRTCATPNACKGEIIVCPPLLKCKVECNAQSACDGVKIDCGQASSCEVICNGDHACKSAEIICGTGPCKLECNGHDNACGEGTKFVCGAQACGLSCNGYDPPSTLECAAAPCSGCPKC